MLIQINKLHRYKSTSTMQTICYPQVLPQAKSETFKRNISFKIKIIIVTVVSIYFIHEIGEVLSLFKCILHSTRVFLFCWCLAADLEQYILPSLVHLQRGGKRCRGELDQLMTQNAAVPALQLCECLY